MKETLEPRSFANKALLTIALLCATDVRASRLELLLADPAESVSSQQCKEYMAFHYGVFSFRTSMTGADVKTVPVTRKMVRDIYREINIASEEELDKMDSEESLFPAQAVAYIRSVNEHTGVTEGIMRLVSGRERGKHYFNNFLSYRHPKFRRSELPVYHKYRNRKFRRWLHQNFPNSFEMGRVVFAKNVNEIRVLVDMGTLVASLGAVSVDDSRASFVAEAVPQAKHRYEILGLAATSTPIEFKGGRIFMTGKVDALHARYLGDVRKGVHAFERCYVKDVSCRNAAILLLDAAIARFTSRATLNKLYTYGYYERASLLISMGRFEEAFRDTSNLVLRNPGANEFRRLHLAAEVGRRYDVGMRAGDIRAARDFVMSPEAETEFSDDKTWIEAQYKGLLLFYRAVIALEMRDWAQAVYWRDAIDRLEPRRVPTSTMGWAITDRLRRQLFDPEKTPASSVDKEEVLATLKTLWSNDHPVGLSAAYRDYLSDVYAAFGMQEDARRERLAGDALRIRHD